MRVSNKPPNGETFTHISCFGITDLLAGRALIRIVEVSSSDQIVCDTAKVNSTPRLWRWSEAAFGNSRAAVTAAALAAALLGLSAQASFGAACKPNHFRPPFFVNSMGACSFDPQSLSFQGDPVTQAKCLMRGMDRSRNLVPTLQSLPPAIAERVGGEAGLPNREALSTFLSRQNLEWDFAANLWQPVSRANDNDPSAPMARYFVIHDTSGPNYGHRDFPPDVDVRPPINNLAHFACADGWGKAHVVVNRAGDMLVNHDFALPWRETKFEQAANFAGALKGLFLHIELIQPRRSAAGHSRRNDARSPDPAFTPAQYDRLALLYTIASVRAEQWLVPAFHSAIDAGIRNGHDDPLNFDVASFADSLERLAKKLQEPPQQLETTAAISVPAKASDATPEPHSSAMPAPEAAETSPSRTAALVKPDADAQPWAERTPQAGREHETGSERKPHERRIVAEHCQTRFAHRHRRRVCGVDAAANRARAIHTVRSVDRRVPRQGIGARHHTGDLRSGHERAKARHRRA